jgi:hypothetical protein
MHLNLPIIAHALLAPRSPTRTLSPLAIVGQKPTRGVTGSCLKGRGPSGGLLLDRRRERGAGQFERATDRQRRRVEA